MDKFFDRFKPKAGNKGGSGSGSKNNNPFANLRLPGQQQGNFQGQGQSLGGSLPGKIIPVELNDPGPLGIQVEKRPNSQGTAIVARVVENSQAAKAGLMRGDILCFAGSDGREEIMYDMFLELAKSNQRPLCFEVRRIPTKSTTTTAGAAAAASLSTSATAGRNSSGGSSSSSSSSSSDRHSAETFARKQAVIAAAEAREKAHKQKSKPIKRQTKSSLDQQQRNKDSNLTTDNSSNDHHEPKSEAAKQAIEAAKNSEAKTAAELGYNPYETNRATAGQARTATVAMTHGTMQDGGGGGGGGVSSHSATSEGKKIPKVQPPSNPTTGVEAETSVSSSSSSSKNNIPISPEFERAYELTVTSNDHAAVASSFAILRKLCINATTKGQQDDEISSSNPDNNNNNNNNNSDATNKFRRVRLANAKIKAAVVDVEGALDLMMAVGFSLVEDEGESVLVFPGPGHKGPEWLPAALKQMEQYEKS